MVDCMLQPKCALLALPLVALVASCGPADNDSGPGGVSVGEARALDEAAEMIEQRRLPDEALPGESGSGVAGEGPPLPPDQTPDTNAATQ